MIQLKISLLPKKLKKNGGINFKLTKNHLVTKDEVQEEYYLFTEILEDRGYFINETTGYLK